MIILNNIHYISPLLTFQEEGDFYMLYIFKRKKDQPIEKRDNHQSVRTIKTYCITSIEYLYKKWDEIRHFCEYFNARAYVHVQKQNHKDVGLNMMILLAEGLKNNQTNFKNLFNTVVGQIKSYSKRWIIDIDTKEYEYYSNIRDLINKLEPKGLKIIATLPTVNGYHLITSPFNVENFTKYCILKKWSIPDIQKKNPTLLYYFKK